MSESYKYNSSRYVNLRVLVSAYACEPNKGSEPGVGWNWIKQIAKYHQVWVITRENNQSVIEEELRKHPLPGVHFYYYDLPYWIRFWKKGSRGIHFYYYLWQIGIFSLATRLHSQFRFDITHHITFVSYRFPSFLSFLPVPFIWGPLGGGGHTPYFMRRDYTIKARINERIRDTSQWLSFVDPFIRITLKRASIILAVNQDTRNMIPRKYRAKTVILPAVGISRGDFCEENKAIGIGAKGNRIKLVSVGVMVYSKAFSLSLRTLAHLNRAYDVTLSMVGDGPESKRLMRMASQLGISDRVEFTGALSRAAALRRINAADILLFPSLRDSGGFVVLEAMAVGKPVVCLDLGGPGEIVTEECGMTIKPQSVQQVLKDLVCSVEKLSKYPDLRRRMGEAGKRRVEEYYMWDKKGEVIKKLYDSVMEKMFTKDSHAGRHSNVTS